MDYHRPLSAAESRRMSLTTGIMWLITFATSIPALWLFQPVLDDPVGYVAGAGHDNRIFLACFLELLLIISNIATAVIPYPLLKRQHEGCALGFVAARIMESTFILVGILSVLTVVGLRTDPPAGVESGHDRISGLHLRRGEGLDVPARARVRRRHRQWTAVRLPDVHVGAGAAADGAAGPDRRAVADRLWRCRHVRC